MIWIMIRLSPLLKSRAFILGTTGLASMLVAVLTLYVNPASATPRYVVALGDSFTSGEGAPPFEPATDTRLNRCHRSTEAYVHVAARSIGAGSLNVACSGARTKDLFTADPAAHTPKNRDVLRRSTTSLVSDVKSVTAK